VAALRTAGVFCVWFATVASAAEPTLTHLYPAAGMQSTTVSIAVGGKSDPWPPQVWIDAPGIMFRGSKTKGKFDVEIAREAALGPHLVRLFNDEGASAPRFFIVSNEPELLETEPNNDFKLPQKIERLPATVSARLDKSGDVDSFAVALTKGQTLVARVEAYVLASTFDGLLRITGQDGTQLAFNHDGRTLDPLLAWEAPHDGTFVVQLMGFVYPANAEVKLTGGEGCVYRLHLTTGPPPRVTLPPHDAANGSEMPEQEPNDSVANAQGVSMPGTVMGCIERAGDEDRFSFTAVKERTYEFKIVAARAGSALDARLRIENQEGKEVGRNDDAPGSRDPLLTWKAPSDGAFFAVIGDVTHHGGADYFYRFAAGESRPKVEATTASHSVSVTGGKTSEIKATVKRANGFKPKLQFAASMLPEGVLAQEVEVPEKDGEITLKLAAEEGAPPVNQPLQLILREVESGIEHPVSYSLISTGEDNGVPQGYSDLVIDSTDQLWLTVIAAPAPKPETPKTQVPLEAKAPN
jgi:hypothetical protein